MNMKSLAKNNERYLEMSSVPIDGNVTYPCFYVDNTQMPEIDKWEVGEEYTIIIKVKMTGYSLNEREEKSTSNATIEIKNYATKLPKSLT